MNEDAPQEKERLAPPWTAFMTALQFLTVAPTIIRRQFTPQELGGAVAYFPLAGLLLGVILALADALLALVFPPVVRSAVLVAVWVLLTGALHLDGFLDSCDGLFGGHSPEKRLAILRDERVGAYALAGGILLLLMKFAAILSLPQRWEALLLAPVLSRWGISLAIVAFPYARQEGLGKLMKDHASWLQAGLATFFALLVTWLTLHTTGLLLILLALIIMWLVARLALRLIPGLTGDIYGAINEIIELVILLALVAYFYQWGN